MLETSRRSERITCDCGENFSATVVRVVNLATDPDLVEALLLDQLNLVHCPHCDTEFPSQTPVYLHEPDTPRYICVYPSAWRSRELSLRIEFYQELLGRGRSAEPGAIPGHVREASFVFSLRTLARLLGRPHPSSRKPGSDQEALRDKPSLTHAIHELGENDFEQVTDVERVNLRDSALIMRWRESGQDYYAFLDEGALHIFQRYGTPEQFGDRADLFFQLHRIENFPLVVLLLVAEGRPSGRLVLYWLFNLDNKVDVRFLEKLSKQFEVHLHLFDNDYIRHRSMVFSPPLEQNVEYVLDEARAWLDDIEPNRRNFFIAVSKFDDKAYHKLGSARAGPDPQAFEDLPTPSVTKLALDILTYWSSRENYEYLIFIKSFPVYTFKAILAAVLKRAIDFGLAMSEKMNRLALESGLATSRKDLAHQQLGNFAEVAAGLKPNDMDLAAQWENWRMLLDDASQQGTTIDPKIQELAERSRSRRGEARDHILLDLSDDVEMLSALDQLQMPELVDLLKDKEHHVEAARVLAENGQTEFLPQVARAFMRMSKKEVQSLGDSLAGFGEAVRGLLDEVLEGARSAQVMGALRALVRLDGAKTAPLLLDEVVAGRRGVWQEAGRLLSGLSDPLAVSIIEASRHPDPTVRIRVIAVLADLDNPQARDRIGEMAEQDPEPSVRRAAKRAQHESSISRASREDEN